MRKIHALVSLVLLGGLLACDILTPEMYKRDVTAVVTGPSSLVAGETAQLTVVLSFSDGTSRAVLPPPTVNGVPGTSNSVTLSSSNPAVATVSNRGLVTAGGPGQTTITVTPDAATTGTGKLIPGTLVITVNP